MEAFNEHKDMKDYLTKDLMDHREQLICPMVFLDEKTIISNSTPNTKSLDFGFSNMDLILNLDPQKVYSMDSLGAVNHLLHGISDNNIENTVYAVANRIVNDTMLSINSAIDISHINTTGLLQYFNIKYYIYREITDYSKNELFNVLRNFYYNLINLKGYKRDHDKDIIADILDNEFKTYSAHYANTIGTAIIYRINNGIEKCVQRIINDSDLDLYDMKNKIKEVFKGIDYNDGHMYTYAYYAICKAIYEELSVSYRTILNNIFNIVTSPEIAASAMIYDAVFYINKMCEEEEKKSANNKPNLKVVNF